MSCHRDPDSCSIPSSTSRPPPPARTSASTIAHSFSRFANSRVSMAASVVVPAPPLAPDSVITFSHGACVAHTGMRACCAPAWVRRAGGDSCGEHAGSAIACTGWYAGTLRADSACHGLRARASRMRTSRAHAPFITCGRWNDHPWRSVCGAPTLICIVIVALNVGSATGSISTRHCGRRTRYPHRGSPGMWITRPPLSHIHRRRLLAKNYSKTKAFFHEIKKRPTRGGSLSQVQRGRISAQPHRCNGKSFHCPPNVIILLIIYFCGSALRLSLYLQLCSEFRITQVGIA